MPTTPHELPNLIAYKPGEGLLTDKFIIITGATEGIGKALASSCAQQGTELLLISKDDKKLIALIQEFSQFSDTAHHSYDIDFSITGETDYIKFAEYIAEQNKPIDSLILNAGYMEALHSIRNYQLELWLRTITVNLHTPFMLAKCCIPLLEMSADPSIVFSTHDCNKAYWSQFKNSPDFVVLFIPGEQFLSAALEKDPQLLEGALKNKVILATPTSIIALLRSVAFGWRQIAVAENAEKIRELGEDLYHRLATLTEHLQKLGKYLDGSIDHYNKAISSLDRQVLTGAK